MRSLMEKQIASVWITLALGGLWALGPSIAAGAPTQGMAATVHPLATEAAVNAMRQGGNAIAPGKRPLSSMSPTLVCKEGKPVLAVGAAGGPTIISQTLLAILQVVDFGRPVDVVMAQPRFHHQWKPDTLQIEAELARRVGLELERRGHRLKVVKSLGAAQAVAWDGDGGGFTGAADPRGEGLASGF